MKIRYLLLAASVWLLASCAQRQKEQVAGAPVQVTITGMVQNPSVETVSVITYDYPGNEEIDLGEATLDSAGNFSMSFPLEQATEARFVHGDEAAWMYLMPDSEMQITLDAEQFDESLSYSGEHSSASNYLADRFMLTEQMEQSLQSQWFLLEPEAFVAYSDSSLAVKQQHLEKFFEDKTAPESFKEMASASLVAAWISNRSVYPMYHRHYAQKEEMPEMPEGYDSHWDKLPMDSPALLTSNAYRAALENQLENLRDEQINGEINSMEDYLEGYKKAFFALKEDKSMAPEIADFLRATALLTVVDATGTTGNDSLMADYRKSAVSEKSLAKVEKTWEGWLKLAPGQPAPDFTFPNRQGEMVSLSDFKGKVVYIDVWATWCGPCLGELPSSKKLKTQYEGNEDVVFMYVSIDENKEAWENMLAEDPEFKGVHIISPDGWESDINKKYMIKGIPRYMLIDREGNIADVDAPRPSSGEELTTQIDKLLEAETVATR